MWRQILVIKLSFVMLTLLGTVLLKGCATKPPADPENLCYIFEEKPGWYRAAQRAEQRWGVPTAVNMAILYQESGFKAKAKPPRKWYLGFIPGPRPSSAFGYAQALDGTWKTYQRKAGRWGADRDDFSDAVDFVGWYNKESVDLLKVAAADAKSLYLVYHEGAGGYRRGSYKNKSWLTKTAARVQWRAQRYAQQLKGCQDRLDLPWWWRLFGV